jgi:hypothetical protein
VVRDGDMIELDVPNRRLHLDIPDAELAARLAAWKPGVRRPNSGYAWLHQTMSGRRHRRRPRFPQGCARRAVGKDSTDAAIASSPSSASARSPATSTCRRSPAARTGSLAATVSAGHGRGVEAFTDWARCWPPARRQGRLALPAAAAAL